MSGGLTAFSNPRVDLQLEGSALGALPAQLGFATRAIESYRIAAKVEERSDAPSPVNLDVTIENTRVRFEGSVDELRALKGIEGRVRAQGPDPAAVLDLFKLPSISLPPYDMAGQVTWRGDEAKVAGLDGKLGDSDISGDAGIDLRPEPPAVTAKLHSDLLDLDDLAGLVGAPPATAPGETASPAQEQRAEQAEQDDRLLPTKEIDPDLWRQADLDVELRRRSDRVRLPADRPNPGPCRERRRLAHRRPAGDGSGRRDDRRLRLDGRDAGPPGRRVRHPDRGAAVAGHAGQARHRGRRLWRDRRPDPAAGTGHLGRQAGRQRRRPGRPHHGRRRDRCPDRRGDRAGHRREHPCAVGFDRADRGGQDADPLRDRQSASSSRASRPRARS